MNFRPHNRRDDLDVNITPLIDIVFLLLIFFMVSTTFSKNTEIAIELPEAQGSAAENINERLEISIDRHGNYFVNERKTVNQEKGTLKQAIEKTVGDKRDLPFVIIADAATPHQSVINTLDVAGQLGFAKITFATREEESTQP